MYKYFKELDRLKEFDVYLSDTRRVKLQSKKVENAKIPDSMIIKYKELFERIEVLNMLIECTDVDTLFNNPFLSYEEYMDLCDLSSKMEEYQSTKSLKNQINIDSHDLEELFYEYSIFCNMLPTIYPNYKDFILTTQKKLDESRKELREINVIEIPEQTNGIKYRFPNSWYITPNGYLYNTGSGHQEGELTYPFYNIIRELLRIGDEVPNIKLYDRIVETLKRGYVTQDEFDMYANLIYKVPTILTPEVEHAMEQMKNILKMSYGERLKMEIPHYARTYQRNIITLQIGYYAAKTALFNSFVKLNDSKHKRDIINTLSTLRFDDMLIRYCNFHKISSVEDKTITTTSINAIESFKEYLDNGWNLDIVPGIVYDEQKDELVEVDFDGYYISKYFDKQLEEYNGNGKIRIKQKYKLLRK